MRTPPYSEWKGRGGTLPADVTPGEDPPRAADLLADLLATVAEGRRAREAAERRMAEDPPETLEEILAPYGPRKIPVLRLVPDPRG